MRTFIQRQRFLFFAALLFLFAACAVARAQDRATAEKAAPASSDAEHAQRLSVRGVHNAGKVDEFLYRGAQPGKQGFEELQKLGVTMVVNLRKGEHEAAREREEVESLKMRYLNIPVSGWAPPTNAQVAQFLSLFKSAEGEKVFVHCRFGDDRTGVMIATYRIAIQQWSSEQAVREMRAFGFHHHWHPQMESYVRNFPAALASDPVFSAIRAQTQKN